MLEITEVAEECRTEDTALITQSWWKQIRQRTLASGIQAALGQIPQDLLCLAIFQCFSECDPSEVSSWFLGMSCPCSSGSSCTGSVPRVMDSAGQFAPAKMMSHPHHPHQTHTWPVRVDWPLPPHKCRNQQKPSCFLSEIRASWRKGNTLSQFLNSSHRRWRTKPRNCHHWNILRLWTQPK